jgi:hypothetical protein
VTGTGQLSRESMILNASLASALVSNAYTRALLKLSHAAYGSDKMRVQI